MPIDAKAAKLTKETSLQGQQFSEELLRQYYKRIFPYDAMFRLAPTLMILTRQRRTLALFPITLLAAK